MTRNNKKDIFVWDKYSDQPYVIKDKRYKKKKRKKYLLEYLLSHIGFFITLPFFCLLGAILKDKKTLKIGMGVNLDKETSPLLQAKLINELKITDILIRIPLCDTQNIKKYKQFALNFLQNSSVKNITINILQDRQHIDNKELLKTNLDIIFSEFSDICDEFQIANAINRIKWGFFSISEFLNFFLVAQKLRDDKYPNIKLIAPNIIDFEYQYLFSALYNTKKVKFDITNNLLYVDRRGSPHNRQLGFSLKNKISLLYAMVKLSPKTKSNKVYITETNWPIKNTAPYAPTSEKECVSVDDYSKFMCEYFDIAKKSGKIDKIFWHQLLAKGYGLAYIDNKGEIIKYSSFFEFKKYIQNESNANKNK